ncbi:MAG: nucleotidyltransferase family protein, partial [Chloroflexota bacterium]
IIINCISATPTVEMTHNLSDEIWDDVAVYAIAVGLAPLLHWHLEQLEVTPPPMAMAKLGITRQAHLKRNQGIAAQLTELLAAYQSTKIDTLVLKGAFLAPTLYPEVSLRPMNDIDLLFREADLSKVGAVLEQLGYAGKHKDASIGPGVTKHLSTYRRDGNEGATPNPYLSAGGDRMVEPHGSLEESWFGLKIDITPGVWSRATATSLHEQPAYHLSSSDMLLHLAVHATFHVIMGASVFVQLYDIKQLLDQWADELDWTEILALSQQANAEPFLYAALYWVNTLFGVSIPEAPRLALKKATPPALVTYIHSLDASGIFERTQHPPLVTLKQRLQRGVLDRQETARWATSLKGKWHVWRTALDVTKTDTARLLTEKVQS